MMFGVQATNKGYVIAYTSANVSTEVMQLPAGTNVIEGGLILLVADSFHTCIKRSAPLLDALL